MENLVFERDYTKNRVKESHNDQLSDIIKQVISGGFIEKYVDYCRKERVRTSEVSFWDSLNSGYTLMLGTMLREEFRKRTGRKGSDSWRNLSIISLTANDLDELFNKHLPKEDMIDTLKGVIGISILENSEAIFDGSGNVGEDLMDYMNTLKDYCYEWEWLWNLVEHLQIELEAQEIKRYLLESSVENANLISWVTSQTRSEQQSVAECYDRMWDELIGAVLRRKESNTEEQHFKLLDWMRKKEENMEK